MGNVITKRAPFALRQGFYLSTMGLGYRADDCQTQARAFALSVARWVYPIEAIEDARSHFIGYRFTGIRY